MIEKGLSHYCSCSLLIDSVKVTSWDPNINDYVKFDSEILQDKEHEHTGIDAVPRPYHD